MRQLPLVCLACLLASLLLGCSSQKKELTKGSGEPVTWDALSKLGDMDVMMPADYAAQMEDWGGFKKHVTSDTFKQAIEEFANSEIPAEYATEARKAAKDEAVKHFREAISLAEKNASPDELKKAWQAAQEALKKVSEPEGEGGEQE